MPAAPVSIAALGRVHSWAIEAVITIIAFAGPGYPKIPYSVEKRRSLLQPIRVNRGESRQA